MNWIINFSLMGEYSDEMSIIYEKVLAKILTNKILKNVEAKLIAVPIKSSKKISFIKNSLDFTSLKEKDFLFEGDYIYMILSTNIDINDGKSFKKVWDLFPELSSDLENSISIYGNHFHTAGGDIYIEDSLIVQGYTQGEFETGYFSDGQSDDYFVSFDDLPQSVQEALNKS
jgi:hypothetical protein